MENKQLGTYTYKQFAGNLLDALHNRMVPTFNTHQMRVQVIGETQRKYKVRYLGLHANGTRVGHETWVGKTKVALDRPELFPREDDAAIRAKRWDLERD